MKNTKLLLWIIIGVTLLAYLPSVTGGFIFDDLSKIGRNIFVKHARYIPKFFQGYEIPHGIQIVYRPLLMITFYLNYTFGRLNPIGYHLVNMLLHVLNVWLVFVLFTVLFPRASRKVILFFVALFALHPINTEAISYISSRSDLLSATCLLLGVITYARGKYGLTLFVYVVGLMVKESVIPLPGLIFAYDLFVTKKWEKKRIYTYLGFVGILIAYVFLRKFVIGKVAYPIPLRSIPDNIATQAAVTFFYLRLFFVPYPLCMDHPFPVLSIVSPLGIAACCGVLVLGLSSFLFRRRAGTVSFFICWFYIALSLKFAATLHYFASEHHLYFPLIGLLGIGVWCAQKVTLPELLRKGLVWLLIPLMFMLTLTRNFDWQDEYHLWRSTVKVNPASGPGQGTLGLHYLRKNLLDKAEEHFLNAILRTNRTTSQTRAYLNLITVYSRQKRYDQALDIVTMALKRFPKEQVKYLMIKKLILEAMGSKEEEEAAVQDQIAGFIEGDAYQTEGMVGLGIWNFNQGKLEEAASLLEQALALDSDISIAHSFLGQVYQEQGNVRGALKAYREALATGSQRTQDYYNVGTILAKQARPEAEAYLTVAVRQAPWWPNSSYNLALFLFEQGRPRSEWKDYLDKAINLGYNVDSEVLHLLGVKEDK